MFITLHVKGPKYFRTNLFTAYFSKFNYIFIGDVSKIFLNYKDIGKYGEIYTKYHTNEFYGYIEHYI